MYVYIEEIKRFNVVNVNNRRSIKQIVHYVMITVYALLLADCVKKTFCIFTIIHNSQSLTANYVAVIKNTHIYVVL